ncbi:MAG TPA: histidine kinase, partial [Vicinamibacterales bacterium]|nr:histidine kinase [Vicinamibacterales bacterium]
AVLLSSLCIQFVWWGPVQEAVMTYLPTMIFVLVTVYYGERLTFFDVFAKRGLLFFLALVTLTSEFALVSPRLSLERMTFVKPWVAALAVVPLVLATPWVYATASQWIDRAWLGRRFSIAGAATHFADSLQGAVSEADLFERAESSLSHVFQSRACVDPGSHEAEEDELRATVRVDGTDWGVARVLARPDEVPFLSEDGELLRILARSLGSALEGQRLRDQRLAHDERERTLVLTAAQAELKVLRAQINPHFLFNALNTIAALIPQKPDRAEQILEQLAEVFRYAVRRSDREWVRLAEEIAFVRSYLDIEQVQFGERLQVRIDVETAVENIRIPAMIIQTLAENAIKHGIAMVRGQGLITISARVSDNRVLVSVEDNGPGFETAPRFDSSPDSSFSPGYGLRNVHGRLRAYFGDEAWLRCGRDAGGRSTVVSFEIPAVAESETGV